MAMPLKYGVGMPVHDQVAFTNDEEDYANILKNPNVPGPECLATET